MSSHSSRLPHSASYPENLGKNRRERDLPKQYDSNKSKNYSRDNSRSRSRSPASERLSRKYPDDRKSSYDQRDGGRSDRLRREARDSPSSGGGGRHRRDSPSDYNASKQRSSNGRMPSLGDFPGFVPGLFAEIDFDSLKIEERKERKASRKACLVPKKPEEECRESFLRTQGDSRGDRHMNEMSRHHRRGDSPIPDLNDEDSQQPQPSYGNKRQLGSNKEDEPRLKMRRREDDDFAAAPDSRRPGRRRLPSGHDFDEDPYEGYYPRSPQPVEMVLPDEPKVARASHKTSVTQEPVVRTAEGPKTIPATLEPALQQPKAKQPKKDDEETEEGELSDSDDDN